MVELESLKSFGDAARKMYEYKPRKTRFTVKHRPFEHEPSMILKATDGPITLTCKVKPDESSIELQFSLLGDILRGMSGFSCNENQEDIEFDVESLFQEDEDMSNLKKRRRGKK